MNLPMYVHPDDHADYSRCMSFFEEHVVFMNNVTVTAFIKLLNAELETRQKDKEDGNS